MFWTLLLCHLIADYPLQTDAMVQAKKHLPGLTLHVAIHLVTMLVIVCGFTQKEWSVTLPIVVTVTLLHFAIDLWKNALTKWKPQWVIGGYLQDQALHLISLLLALYWVAPPHRFAVSTNWIIYASGYMLVTHAWFVTERVLTYRNKARQMLVNAQLWPRMISRAFLLTLLLLGWHQNGSAGLIIAGFFAWPYHTNEQWPRFWQVDIVVVGAVMGFILVAQRFVP